MEVVVVVDVAIMILIETTTPSRDPVLLLTKLPQLLQQMGRTRMLNVSELSIYDQTEILTKTDGGYQNYVALWYQSLMYQQQQGGDAPPAGAPAPGAP